MSNKAAGIGFDEKHTEKGEWVGKPLRRGGESRLVPFQLIRARRGGHLAEPTRPSPPAADVRASANWPKKFERP